MSEFKQYRRSQVAELRPYVLGESLDGVSISSVDREAGSPLPGDMIARNPKNHADQWLVAAKYFADNFEPLDEGRRAGEEWRADDDTISLAYARWSPSLNTLRSAEVVSLSARAFKAGYLAAVNAGWDAAAERARQVP